MEFRGVLSYNSTLSPRNCIPLQEIASLCTPYLSKFYLLRMILSSLLINKIILYKVRSHSCDLVTQIPECQQLFVSSFYLRSLQLLTMRIKKSFHLYMVLICSCFSVTHLSLMSCRSKCRSAQVLRELLGWKWVGTVTNSKLKFPKMVRIWVNQVWCNICSLSEVGFTDFPRCTAFAQLSVCDQRGLSLLEEPHKKTIVFRIFKRKNQGKHK